MANPKERSRDGFTNEEQDAWERSWAEEDVTACVDQDWDDDTDTEGDEGDEWEDDTFFDD